MILRWLFAGSLSVMVFGAGSHLHAQWGPEEVVDPLPLLRKVLPVDWDGDGRTDLAVAYPTLNEIRWLRNTGSTMVEEAIGMSSRTPTVLRPCDLDGDGLPEVLSFSLIAQQLVITAWHRATTGWMEGPPLLTDSLLQADGRCFQDTLFALIQDGQLRLFATTREPWSALDTLFFSGEAYDLTVLPPGPSAGNRLAIATSGGVLEVRLSVQGRVDSARLHIAPGGVLPIALRSCDLNGDGWVDLVVLTGSRELFWLAGPSWNMWTPLPAGTVGAVAVDTATLPHPLLFSASTGWLLRMQRDTLSQTWETTQVVPLPDFSFPHTVHVSGDLLVLAFVSRLEVYRRVSTEIQEVLSPGRRTLTFQEAMRSLDPRIYPVWTTPEGRRWPVQGSRTLPPGIYVAHPVRRGFPVVRVIHLKGGVR